MRSGTGLTRRRSRWRQKRQSTTSTGRKPPARKSATSCSGSTVAEQPMRIKLSPLVSSCGNDLSPLFGPKSIFSSSSLSRLRLRCTPLLEAAREWISSTITQRTVLSFSRKRGELRRMARDSGVVLRIWGVLFSILALSCAEMSPCRMACLIS